VVQSLITFIVGLIGGAIGWWLAYHFAKPVERVDDLRRRAHEELIFYANIGTSPPEEEWRAAITVLRKMAAGLIASSESASPLVHWYIRLNKWNLEEAGGLLLAKSNIIGKPVDPNLAIVADDNLCFALGLPATYSKESVLMARNALGVPARN
jgi:hypothetical protein